MGRQDGTKNTKPCVLVPVIEGMPHNDFEANFGCFILNRRVQLVPTKRSERAPQARLVIQAYQLGLAFPRLEQERCHAAVRLL